MPKRYMSNEEYSEQQYYYRHKLKSPQDLQEFLENKSNNPTIEDAQREENMERLKERLHAIVIQKVDECLTDRQKKVIRLYLLSKKQDYMGAILQVTQEAIHSRLDIAFRRLKKACLQDKEILEILKEMKIS